MKWLKSSAVSIGLIGVIFLIIIPVPAGVLDFLFMLNLSVGVVILLTALFIQDTLQFSIFPSLLLMTTLFRLALEISATRLILGNSGDAGAVIAAFGSFVIKGNLVVGVVVFLIIVVVQFIVITKGSERVAEVAARFTLDAMPGKQMAIDADLNAGIITEPEARRRRTNIQREADFYGSMDGASKFVKGDATVAILIVIINIVGGVISGLVAGENIQKVLTTYTQATIGEGLLAQLPALLISVATGLIVTRAASDANISQDLASQLLSRPLVLRITGGVLLFIMFLPGFPAPVLFLEGALFIVLSFVVDRRQKRAAMAPAAAAAAAAVPAADAELKKLQNPENVYQYLEVETIEMEFGYSLIPLVDESQGGTFVDKVVMFRKQFALDTGMVIPSVRMRDNIQLGNNTYAVKIRGEEVARGELLAGSLLIMNPSADTFDVDGVDTVEPAFGLKARWISPEKRSEADQKGYTVIDPASVMMTHLSEIIRRHAWELLGRKEVNALLDTVKKNNASLVEEIVPNKLTVGELQKVLQNLLRESVPIRDMVGILETLADHAPKIKDPDLLSEFARQGLRRTISHRYAPQGELQVITVDPQVEQLINQSVHQTDSGAYLAIEPDKAQAIIDNLTALVGRCGDAGIEPVVLAAPQTRLYLKRLTEQALPDLVVISYNELENDVKLQALGAVAA